MPKPTKGARLGGGPAHERLILANLAQSLFEHKSITTTEARAKRLRPVAERLISKAKRGDLHARRQVHAVLSRKDIVHVLFAEIAPVMAERQGGYTRITKIAPRKGDNAPMAVIELVMEPLSAKQATVAEAAAATKRAVKDSAAVELAKNEVAESAETIDAEVESTTDTAEVDAGEDSVDEPSENTAEATDEATESAEDDDAAAPSGKK